MNSYSFSLAFLEQITPYFVIWHKNSELLFLSNKLCKIWKLSDFMSFDQVQKEQISHKIKLIRPFRSAISLALLEELTGMTLHIIHEDYESCILRGQVLFENEFVVLILNPMIREIEDIERIGIDFTDLPIHDGTGDLLVAVEATKVSLKQTNEAMLQLEKINEELSMINESFSYFVPKPFLDYLGIDSPTQAKLGVHVESKMTVMFSDIRGFTTMSENMTPTQIFDLLNRYLSRVGPKVRAHGGFVDKYIGDAIMALFSHKANDALDASIAMHQELDRFNVELLDKNEAMIKIGVGLHCGKMTLGIIGEERRFDTTVISDVVNTASRLEGLTKIYGARILVTQEIVDELTHPHSYALRYLGKVAVAGKKIKLAIYEVLNALSPELMELRMETLGLFQEALAYMDQLCMEEAAELLMQVIEIDVTDEAAKYYLKQVSVYL